MRSANVMTTVGARNVSGKSVVVGVDGSASDRTALAFAIDEAVMRRSSLQVIAAVQPPDYGLASPTMLELPSPEKLVHDVLIVAQSRVDELVAAYGEGVDDVSIAVEAVAGHPGDVLCDAADGAELLVLGHRGRGATAARLIGSVGLHCVLHANCPVTVLRPDAEARVIDMAGTVGSALRPVLYEESSATTAPRATMIPTGHGGEGAGPPCSKGEGSLPPFSTVGGASVRRLVGVKRWPVAGVSGWQATGPR